MVNKCKECGCMCTKCIASDHEVHLHVEIENLKQKLVERENYIVTMETNFLNEANKFPNGELGALREELLLWQDKYKRLYDAHKRIQRVNQGLEDKLLKLVDVGETEKNTLTKDVASLSQKLAEANYTIKKLSEDNERYKNDVSLAIQFLQCKQSNYVAHKFDSLPQEVQAQVSSFMTNKRKPEEKKVSYEMKSIKVPIPTFPPTAMVYSVPKSPNPNKKLVSEVETTSEVDIVSAAIMAKVLEERQKEKAFAKHCDTCTCSDKLRIVSESTYYTVGTQTGDCKESVCLRCNDPLWQSPQRMRLVKSEANIKKVPPVYNNDLSENAQTNGNNIVKVQPNNFLLNETSLADSSNSCLSGFTEEKSHPDVNFHNVNETSQIKNVGRKSPKLAMKVEHHHLCNKSSPTYEIEPNKNLLLEPDAVSAKNGASDGLKGPRYCSMRLQSGSKNILLDNAHNNIAPVLYKRHPRPSNKEEEVPVLMHKESSQNLKNLDLLTDDPSNNHQRVVDWITNNLGNEIGSSDNSQVGSVVSEAKKKDCNKADKKKYAEMEEHVKRFLFGESEFLKTVELGKLKYQNLRENECGDKNSSASNSHTETEI